MLRLRLLELDTEAARQADVTSALMEVASLAARTEQGSMVRGVGSVSPAVEQESSLYKSIGELLQKFEAVKNVLDEFAGVSCLAESLECCLTHPITRSINI